MKTNIDWLTALYDNVKWDDLVMIATEKPKPNSRYVYNTDWMVEHYGTLISNDLGLDGFSKEADGGQLRKNYVNLGNAISNLRNGKFGQDESAIRNRVAAAKATTTGHNNSDKSINWPTVIDDSFGEDKIEVLAETATEEYTVIPFVEKYGEELSKHRMIIEAGGLDKVIRTRKLFTFIRTVRAYEFGIIGGTRDAYVRLCITKYGLSHNDSKLVDAYKDKEKCFAEIVKSTKKNKKKPKCRSTGGNTKANASKKKPTTKKVSTTTTTTTTKAVAAAAAAAATKSANELRSRRRSERKKTAAAKDSSSVGSDDNVSSNGSSSNQGRFNEGGSNSNSKSDGDSDSNGDTNQAKEVRSIAVNPPPSSAPSTSTSTEEGVAASPTQEVSRSTAETLSGDKSRHEELNDADNDTNVDVVGVGELTDIDIDNDNESIDGDNEGGFDIESEAMKDGFDDDNLALHKLTTPTDSTGSTNLGDRSDNGDLEGQRNPTTPTIVVPPSSNNTTNLDVEKRNNEVDHNSNESCGTGTIPLPFGSGNGDGDGVPPAYGNGGNRTNTNNNGSEGTLESPSSSPSGTGKRKRENEKDPCLSQQQQHAEERKQQQLIISEYAEKNKQQESKIKELETEISKLLKRARVGVTSTEENAVDKNAGSSLLSNQGITNSFHEDVDSAGNTDNYGNDGNRTNTNNNGSEGTLESRSSSPFGSGRDLLSTNNDTDETTPNSDKENETTTNINHALASRGKSTSAGAAAEGTGDGTKVVKIASMQNFRFALRGFKGKEPPRDPTTHDQQQQQQHVDVHDQPTPKVSNCTHTHTKRQRSDS